MYPSNIRQKIRDDALILGTSMFSYEPHVAAAIYQTGPDWVWIDQEHAPVGHGVGWDNRRTGQAGRCCAGDTRGVE